MTEVQWLAKICSFSIRAQTKPLFYESDLVYRIQSHFGIHYKAYACVASHIQIVFYHRILN